MSKIALKINIAGRLYPLNILTDEKDRVELAAKQINDAIEFLKKNYSVKDSQDLLAMASLQLIAKKNNTKEVENNHIHDSSEIHDLLSKISLDIKSIL